MEDLNEMQPNVQNDDLHVAPEATPVADADTLKPTQEPSTPAEVQPEEPIAPVVEKSEEPAVPEEEKPQEPAPTEEPIEEPVAQTEEQPQEPDPAEEPAPAENPTPTEEEESEEQEDYTTKSREELLEALKVLMTDNIMNIRNRASAIRNQFNLLTKEMERQALDQFVEDGGNKEDYQPVQDALAEAFHKVYDTYRAMRQKMLEEIEQKKVANLEAKRGLLEELRTLIDNDEESLKQTYDQFNALQERWKAIGDVPRDQMNDLWQNYHFLIEQFFNKVKINKELRMLDLKRNLEQKLLLCERAEELMVETSVLKAVKAMQELRAQWREIGPVPTENNEETWQRFNNALNQIDERRREYYDQRREEFEQNLLAKKALIEKATELTAELPQTVKGWNDATTALDELLKLWKSIGPVPRDQNEEVWNQFKAILDKHFADKKLYFGQIRDEQTANYNKKVELCLRAEAIAKREDWKNATQEMLELQSEWKAIGATSRKVSEKIWHRFRSACDEFFAKKEEYFKGIRSGEEENLAQKTAIIEEMKAYNFGDNSEENLAAVQNFQRRWAEIGHVPMKEKNRIQKEYRTLLDSIYEKLKISAREAEAFSYRERVQSRMSNPKFLSTERGQLMNQIEKMRADLTLWENNIGFLASSKQADLLKQEFEKKMQNARQQIALLEAKVRMLDKAEREQQTEE